MIGSIVVLCCALSVAQIIDTEPDDFMAAVALLSGAGSEEDLDEQEIERYIQLSRRPLRINRAGTAELSSCGLLSRYQIASLMDYRSRHGDILSVAELAVVDGFGEAFAIALSHFISLQSERLPGELEQKPVPESEVLMRFCTDMQHNYAHGAKIRLSAGDRFSLGLTDRRAYGRGSDDITGSLAMKFGRLNLIVGDFHARFGQGLVWRSGFSMTGFSSVASFMRNPTGLAPAWSYSSPGRGAAANIGLRRSVLSAAVALDDQDEPRLLLNLTRYFPMGQLGSTVSSEAVSADTRFCVGKIDFFGEAAADLVHRSPAFIAGAVYNPEYQHKLAMRFRYYSAKYKVTRANAGGASARTADEAGLTLGYETAALTITMDAMRRPSDRSVQYRSVMQYITPWNGPLKLTLRITERIRPQDYLVFRTDARVQADYLCGGWSHALRLNMLHCRESGLLGYYELGRKFGDAAPGKISLNTYTRMTLFSVDKWDDRIYVYERDAPGNFSSRVYYGRGWNFQCFAGTVYRTSKWRRYSLYARLMLQDCTRNGRKAEIRLQAMMEF